MTKIVENISDKRQVGMRRKTISTQERVPNVAIFLKRTSLEFLQIIFGARAKDHFHYDKDDSLTDIQISDIHAVNLTTVNRRPAVIATRGPLSWQGTGLGGNSLETRNMKTGDHTFNDMLIGSVSFSCMSREGVEAEQLAHIVFNSFKFFRPELQKYGFMTIKSMNIGAETLIEQEGSEDVTTIVPVYITAMIQDRWTLSDEAGRKLREIVTTGLFNY